MGFLPSTFSIAAVTQRFALALHHIMSDRQSKTLPSDDFVVGSQRSGNETVGIVQRLLTNASNHPRGIKVMLSDGQVGRVRRILDDEE